MPYRTVLLHSVTRKLAEWRLPDSVFVDVQLMLRELLPDSPTTYLRRREQPFDGMTFEFSLIDPQQRTCVHAFAFLVIYGTDEQTLYVVNGGYVRREGI